MKKKVKQRHSIRKYKAGASSVLLGLFVFFGLITEEKVSAAEILPGQSETSKKKKEGASPDSSGTSTSSSGSATTTSAVDQTTTDPYVNATNVSGNQVAMYPTPPNSDVTSTTTTPTNTSATDATVMNNDTTSSTTTSPSSSSMDTTPQTTSTENNVTTDTTTTSTQNNATADTTTTSTPSTETTTTTQSSTESTPSQQTSTTTTTSTPDTSNSTTSTPSTNSTATTGSDITNKVQIVSSSIEGNSTVNPHNAERVTLKYDWKFPDGMKQGDYFDFVLSNNVNTSGISTARKLPDILNGSLVMATGQLIDNHTIRYTFTDYINNKVNVTGNLSLNLFIDPKVVTSEGNQTITATLNGQTTSKEVVIDYLEGVNLRGVNINGSIEYLDKNTNTFKHIAYVNPGKYTVNTPTLRGQVTSGAPTTNQPTVKIYEYIGTGSLNQSVYVDTTNTLNFKDVTDTFSNNLIINNSGYYLTMNENLTKTYVVTYEGQYSNNANELNFRTELAGYPSTYPYYYTSVKWDNGVVFYSNKGTGNGIDQPIIESNNFVFTEDTGSGAISGQYDGPMVEVEEDPLTISYDSVPETVSGSNETVVEEYEDSAPIQFEENTTPDSMTGAQVTVTEEFADSAPIEFEENTLPDNVTGSYAGAVEFYEDTNIVDYVEDTTPEGMTGSNTGVTEEIEENDVVEDSPVEPIITLPSFNLRNVIQFNPITRITGIGSINLNRVNHFNVPKFNHEVNVDVPEPEVTPEVKINEDPTVSIENEPELNEVTSENNVSDAIETLEEDRVTADMLETEPKTEDKSETQPSNELKDEGTASEDVKEETTLQPQKMNQTTNNANPSPSTSLNNHIKAVQGTTNTKHDTSTSTNKMKDQTVSVQNEVSHSNTKQNLTANNTTTPQEATTHDNAKDQSQPQRSESLPETGQSTQQTGIWAIVMALLGMVFAFRRRKQKDKE
ncbi:fibrinogen-binding adhesin SdrG C-terminal domain-containing protein [Staphylococcus agnetis]|uniref:fibrinogen-binding adhesin SdrG C-terminal domain-containing protein n=1 Tax=Staphylococcus agnetis TaxID=985762 RepID=UPI00208E2782|nr:fibrinogen-binding adhesin SdrG C-terminal domain-containing protein [Staphylococcus agnetis]MCO4347765.1 fibrinogen-binding adhesin SdrG C-terminal domain-containing protein [Staphylococcus agnetis]